MVKRIKGVGGRFYVQSLVETKNLLTKKGTKEGSNKIPVGVSNAGNNLRARSSDK